MLHQITMEELRKTKQRHFILVHGACHGAWCWYKLVTLLESAGHRITVPDLASSGINLKRIEDVTNFADYSEPLMEIMASLSTEERVVLVGHSYGGVSIATAADRFPQKVAAVVFVTAFMPDCSNPPYYVVDQFFSRKNPLSTSEWMDSQFNIAGEGPLQSMLFGPNFMASKLYQLSPQEDLVLAKTLVRPVPMVGKDGLLRGTSVLSKDRYGLVPRFYIVATEDIVLTKEYQQWMVHNYPVNEVKEIKGADHMAMLSKPKELCQCLVHIADGANNIK